MEHTRLDLVWVALTSALVFIMQGGFALLESGLTRSKNSINVAAKNLTDLGVSVLCFWLVGFGLMFGSTSLGWTGADHFFFSAPEAWPGVFFLFQAMFCSTSATIVSGAVAERMKFSAYLVATVLMSALLYPIAGHWAWGGALNGHPEGWLNSRGFVDFAGSTVVHSIGGWVSLAALLVIGPRAGRYDSQGQPVPFPGSNVPMAVTGVILLWFGWFGFNGGSTLAVNDTIPRILVNTTVAGAAGMIACLALGWAIYRKPDVSFIINGSLGGLVAITANCHAVTIADALIIGSVGGGITLAVSALLDRWGIDDAVGAVPVHLGAGIWGTLCVGLFGRSDWLGTGLDRGAQILIQCEGIAAVGIFCFGTAFIFFWVLNKVFPLRVSEEDEEVGLNMAEHGASTEAYGLFRTLEAQSRTGDLSLRAPVEPFTEVGQIARQYNRVLDHLQLNVVAKTEYVSILDNVNEGLFLLDGHGRIGPFYSAALERILGRKHLSGLDFTVLLASVASPGVMEPWHDFFDLLFDPSIDEQAVSRLNPLRQVELMTSGKQGLPVSRHAQFHFRRVIEDGRVVRAMVVLRDTTQEVKLQNEVAQQGRERDQEMELFYRILHLDPASLRDFLVSFATKVGQINRMMETGQNAPVEILKHSLRLLHAIKGEAQLLELDFLATASHDLEDMIQVLQRKPGLENSDFLAFALQFSQFQEMGSRMDRLVERLASFQTDFLSGNRRATLDPDRGALAVRLESLADRVASETGKKVHLDWDEFDVTLLQNDEVRWREILVQLVRNAIVHGIEPPSERLQAKKAEVGRLSLTVSTHGSKVTVSVRDDGRGIRTDELARRALESGIPASRVNLWTKTDYVRFLFKDGVTTSPDRTTNAGRGVGLSLVSSLVRDGGGRLGVRFEAGRYTEFQVTLPVGRS